MWESVKNGGPYTLQYMVVELVCIDFKGNHVILCKFISTNMACLIPKPLSITEGKVIVEESAVPTKSIILFPVTPFLGILGF